jgi:urease gamma subunit
MTESPPNLRPQQAAIYEAFRTHGAPATDAEIAAVTGISGNSFRPRRRELADLGLLEKAGTRPTGRGREVTLWMAVEDPERVEELRAKAQQRQPRRKQLRELPFEMRLAAVNELLKDDDLNSALLNQQGRSWSRARGRARGARREHEREMREVKAKLAEEERDRSTLVDFLKAKRNLLKTVEVVRSVEEFVREDLQRRAEGKQTRIPPQHWAEVADLLADAAAAASDAEKLVRDQLGLVDDVIDVNAHEVVELVELTEEGGGDHRHQRSEEPDG